jgi:hypothetical protein
LFLCEELKLICGRFADDRFIVLRKLLVREPGFGRLLRGFFRPAAGKTDN